MSKLDGTGPVGQGSQTGRRLRKCNSNKQGSTEHGITDEQSNEFGRGFRLGRKKGCGRGLGRNNF